MPVPGEKTQPTSVSNSGDERPRKLFLSRVTKDYNPDRDSALGPWCFIGFERQFAGWENIDFVDAFDGHEEMGEAADAAARLVSHRIGVLAQELNMRHDRDYSSAYWWALAAPWLSYLIPGFWRRWVLLEKFIKTHGHANFSVQVLAEAEQVDWKFPGFFEFLHHGLRSETFDFWLFSLILSRLAPANWQLEPLEVTIGEGWDNFGIPQPPVRRGRWARPIRRRLGHLPVIDVPGLGRAWSLIFSGFVQLLPRQETTPDFLPATGAEVAAQFPDAFLSLLDLVIERTTPKFLNEDYKILAAEADTHTYRKGRLFVTSPSHNNVECNFRIAHALEAGERVVRIQAGAGYGTALYDHHLALTEYAYQGFLTWGWRAQNGRQGKFQPVPAPGLSRKQNSHKERNSNILFVGTLLVLRNVHIGTLPSPSHFPAYRREKISFIEALNDPVRDALVYCPYRRSIAEMEEETYLRDRIPDLSFHSGVLEDDLVQCRLLVLDHPGSTLNFALAANVPTVCFWDRDQWPLALEAEPLFSVLKSAGVLWESGKDAGEQANAVFDDVAKWWNREEVQRARLNWVENFARTSNSWWYHWARALRAL